MLRSIIGALLLLTACDSGSGNTPNPGDANQSDAKTSDSSVTSDVELTSDASPCPPGSQNCPCAASDACDDGLSCQQGFCITAAPCPVGTDGCPCDAGSCGEGLSCQADVCAPSTPCPVGTLGCPCGPNDACDAGGLCGAGVCQPAGEGQRVTLNDPEIRACDLLFEIDPAAALSVTLSDSIKGRHRRKEGRFAIAWIALEDAAPEGAVIQLAGGPARLILTECYGRHGEPLAEPGLRLE